MPTVDTDALRAVAERFESEVGAQLDKAKQSLARAQGIEYSNFTNVHIPLAVVYVEAWNFENRDLETKRQNVTTFRDKLKKTADDWDSAEQASTIKPGGPS